MKTGAEYLASIDDGRRVWFEGELVDRIEDHPILGAGATLIAEGYDKVYDPTGDHSPFSDVPTDAYPESFVILEDVFVPTERVFLDGQTRYATVFAHSLGLWERLGGLSSMADGADLLVGLAQLIAQANGTESVAHVRDKIDDMLIQATLIRASLEAAITHCHVGDNGAAFPDELYTNAGKYYAASHYDRLVQSLHDIAGGSIVTAPSLADLRNPEIGPAVRKYMQANPEIDGEIRLRLFHLIRDISADTYGGWRLVTNIQAGGGLYAQKIVTRKWYPMDKAVAQAKELVGVPF
ncbi:4-hydroxyphenylacetate 3-hydroxylase C-terminal domain-containing protein [Pseudonocardia oroxyli]|uniref:4-hydroxybutyryl-CoA dehydratase / vinylacetyl-CoA-Delta-isomerase n=1 Tax=Pseudonocardia oroxyli TaxID=366584 RepID=A0A1G7X6G1_PSEOR|nr:4-hydroxyphenylacetate 3-hydroxylase C-terminal domain-containing protein [Pseudonocardia oroxyli]SDG79737.1 4-hydroxybutyryl-CoA dehydratase / vinylacetyl-CoA-Delta-isomerase [Pseudonocardia oroxyli]